jgi:hypothetical protein
MAAIDYTQPAPPRSKAWCSDCTWKAWGIWAHTKTRSHLQDTNGSHLVHLVIPETPGQGA